MLADNEVLSRRYATAERCGWRSVRVCRAAPNQYRLWSCSQAGARGCQCCALSLVCSASGLPKVRSFASQQQLHIMLAMLSLGLNKLSANEVNENISRGLHPGVHGMAGICSTACVHAPGRLIVRKSFGMLACKFEGGCRLNAPARW